MEIDRIHAATCTGMAPNHVSAVLAELAEMEVIRIVPIRDSIRREAAFQKDYSRWKTVPNRDLVPNRDENSPKSGLALPFKKIKITTLPSGEGELEKFDFQHAINRYRAFAKKVGAPGCLDWVKWDESRKRRFRAQVKKEAFDWEKILLAAYDSPFIRDSINEGKSWFNIDFLMQPKSWQKLLEGGYGRGYARRKQQSEEPKLVL